MTRKEIRESAIRNAKSVNNVLTDEFLEDKSDRELLAFTHPLDREVLRKQLDNADNKKSDEKGTEEEVESI